MSEVPEAAVEEVSAIGYTSRSYLPGYHVGGNHYAGSYDGIGEARGYREEEGWQQDSSL